MSESARAADTRERVGPYVLVKAIGAGGSARIDLARIERAYGFQRHVVIKRPLEHLRNDARAAESIRREARLGARLRHPNLVSVLDAGVCDGYDYLVLELVHGGSLRTLMETDRGPRVRDVPLDVALAVVRDVARGLHEAHELHDEQGAPLGLVHRDVSPGNVLVGLDGAIKLADFGIAKETRVATLSGSMHGTVTYMAPEQCRGHAFDRRADIFSLGVILYELATGHRLFWADNDVASLHRVLSGNVVRPRKLRANIAPALEEIVMTAIAHDQGSRFATARAFADALEGFASAAGHIVAARHVARWAHEILGPRESPWIGEPTVVDVQISAFTDSRPLVDVIAAAPPPDEPLLPTFGPSDVGAVDEPPVAQPPIRRSRRALVAGVVGAALVGGVVAVVLTSRETERPPVAPAATAPAADAVAPAVEPTAPASVGETAPEPEPVDDADDAEAITSTSPPPTSAPTRRKKRRPGASTASTKSTGSGAGTAQQPPKKVEWDRTMLLPTDQKR